MGHIGADTQAHQFWQRKYWASRVSTGPQFIYTGFRRMSRNKNRGSERGTKGRHTKHRLLADKLLGFKSKHRTTIYI